MDGGENGFGLCRNNHPAVASPATVPKTATGPRTTRGRWPQQGNRTSAATEPAWQQNPRRNKALVCHRRGKANALRTYGVGTARLGCLALLFISSCCACNSSGDAW